MSHESFMSTCILGEHWSYFNFRNCTLFQMLKERETVKFARDAAHERFVCKWCLYTLSKPPSNYFYVLTPQNSKFLWLTMFWGCSTSCITDILNLISNLSDMEILHSLHSTLLLFFPLNYISYMMINYFLN